MVTEGYRPRRPRPVKENFIFGCPLSLAYAQRAIARWCFDRRGWRDDLRHALTLARSADPMSYATAVTYVYCGAIPGGVLRPDDDAVREIEDALRIAERSSDDLALTLARMTLGFALVHREVEAERNRGHKLLTEIRDVFGDQGHNLSELPIVNIYLAREWVRRGDPDEAIQIMRTAADHLFRDGQLGIWGIQASGVLVETLLDRGGHAALADAAIERLASRRSTTGSLYATSGCCACARCSPGSRRRCGLPRSTRTLPGYCKFAWLRGTYRVGRGEVQ